ncbi:MAG: hypothetical protein DI551_04435 [Micavibrio aeruginosavorus]|uniref:DUF1150 domain-containing protein n=1 Tax=Micavibrio aeruginosavorus TaxID=349221 RepID=A0A2W5N029_9BACT|nr:MAG: hypothetical protein DI551_04435 [Micavibrio aeruginosavorus]
MADMNNNPSEASVRNFLKGLSTRDFLRIGMDEIAYVRSLPIAGQTKNAYAIYAADGTQLSVLDSMDMAIATLRHHDLLPVTLH